MQFIKKAGWIALTLAIFLIGCGDPRIDGTSDDTFRASTQALTQSLTEANRRQFDIALKGFEFLFSENAMIILADSSRIKNRMRTRLGGLTVQEVLDLWDERRDKAIKELEEKKSNTEVALEQLKDVVIQKSRYYAQHGQSVIELKVKNDTERTISRVYFHGTLTSRGRRTPWVEDDFNYNIPEGLEPEKSATWNFALLATAWKQAPKNRKNLRLNITVTRIDGEDNEAIYDAYTNRFSMRDKERLDTLKTYQTDHVAENNEP